jgi:hypothetical protein
MSAALSFLLLQAGRGRLFPEFENPIIFIVLIVLMAALIAYAIVSRER